VNAEFSKVPPPSRFGSQYLTYVVWAISPDGRPENLGELMLDASNKAKLRTSTSLQTFAMIVTAEPHFSVSQPSDAMVMENVLAPGTVGRVEEVNATYELLPRKEFTYDITAQQAPGGKPVSRDEYDAIVAIYQAQNAVQMAEAENADRYAPDRMSKARQLLEKARSYPKNLSKDLVALAREATQVAEDARTIAVKRAEDERTAEQAVQTQKQELVEAAREAREASEQRAAEEAEDAGRAAESTLEPSQPSAAPETSTQPAPPSAAETAQPASADRSASPISVDPNQFSRRNPTAMDNRSRLLATIGSVFDVRDTPRGIVATIPEQMVGSGAVRGGLTRLASAIQPYRDLNLTVEAHSDDENSLSSTQRQAAIVRNELVGVGISPDIIMARGLGNDRPLGPNNTAAGRAQNRRVEIIVAGDAIGPSATWDRPYRLQPSARRR
jgi:flagellar motor protein MotB